MNADDYKFNKLISDCVWDNAEGSASCKANKTSVYLFNKEKRCRARLVNISTSEIDEIDEFSLSVMMLLRMIRKYTTYEKDLHIRLNKTAHEQLRVGIYKLEGVPLPKKGDFKWQLAKIAGVKVVITRRITNNQATVL